MSRGTWKNSRIPINCTGCGIPFFVRRCHFMKDKKFYHSRDCYKENGTFVGKKQSRYINHYWCESCYTWIPKGKAPLYTSKSGKSIYPICPNPVCGNRKLTTA